MTTKNRTSAVRLCIAGLLAFVGFIGGTFAGSFEYNNAPPAGQQSFATRYPTYFATYSCSSCHTASIPQLQAYGTAYKTATLALATPRTQANVGPALANIESSDSDADGYKNIVEINANKKAYDAAEHPTASVATNSAQSAKSGAPAATVAYTVTVTNNGNFTDSFTLGVATTAGQSWTPTIVGTANNVAAAGTANVTVNVAISGAATNGQSSTSTFTATSQGLATVSSGIALTTTAVAAAARYVSPTGTNTGVCTSSAAPCRTITYALSQALAGDPISVGPGIYNAALGESFPIIMKSGIQLQATSDAFDTIVDGGGTQGLMDWAGNNSSSALIRGIQFRNGLRTVGQGGSALGGALYISGATANITIQRCIFRNNEVRGYSADNSLGHTGGLAWGGAVAIFSSPVQIMDSLFQGNVARGGNGFSHPASVLSTNEYGGQGHGGALYFAGTGAVVNNTFQGNTAVGGNGGIASNGAGVAGAGAYGGIAATGNPAPNIYNNIFHGNAANSGTGTAADPPSTAGAMYAPNAVTVTKNLYFANTVNGGASSGDTLGTASIAADPQFHNSFGNLRIGLGSPARNAGTVGISSVDLDQRIRPGGTPSIGAFEAWGADMPYMDVGGDGKSDIIYRNSANGGVYRMRMNGLAIAEQGFVYNEPNTAWKIVADGDFNGDGISDLLWRNSSSGLVYIMPFTSAGFPAAGAFVYTEANPAWKIIATPDLNGDGMSDILWWNSSSGLVYAVLMNGFSIIGQGFVYQEPNTQWQIAGVGDFSGSGRQNQLLWRNSANGLIYLQTVNYAAGSFSQTGQIIYQSLTTYNIVAVADFNGDGRSDILWRNDSTGQVYMMFMNGPAITFEGVIYSEPNAAWKIIAAGDYNNDGKSDILWRNVSTGGVYLMLMNGGTIASQTFLYNEPDLNWKILGPYEYSQ
jgi:hypothetical protein